MVWIQSKECGYGDVYYCSNCGQGVMVMDSSELPVECVNCGEIDEECN